MRSDHPMMSSGRVQNGFTLIEIMIVVAIIGIIAAIAIPSYQNYVEETRRSTAQSHLMQVSQWMERRYSETFDYSDGGSAPALPDKFKFSPQERDASNAFYEISFDGISENSFTLQAEPINAHSGDACGILKLDEEGNKEAAEAGCW